MIEDQELRSLFHTESEEHLQHLEQGLLKLEQDPQNQGMLEEVFRQAHSLKGEARMLGLADIETIAHRFESILGGARKGDAALSFDVIERLYQALDTIRRLVHQAVTGEPAGVVVREVMAQLEPANDQGAPEKAAAGKDVQATLMAHSQLRPEPDETAPAAAPAEPEKEEPKDAGNDGKPVAGVPTGSPKFRIETIRVATEKLDVLMTQAGELSVIKNRVAHGLERLEEVIGVWEGLHRGARHLQSLLRERGTVQHNGFHKRLMDYHRQEAELLERLGVLLSDIKSSASEDSSKLDYVTNELEGGVKSLRLLPLATILKLFPRLVRDLTRSQAKEVQLIIEGEDTNADKRIIEEMKDPLMHLVRNALDHGIESPAERERLGKPREGSIRLKAYQTSNAIVLEVSDDGQGLDLEAIKHTATKKIPGRAAALEVMTPAELQGLIFHSGFSTSTFISDVSGRGVGLDVVRANVERLKGSIQVDSVPGEGCTFRMRLPLTMATARVLIVGVNGIKYAILIEAVGAIQLVDPREIFTVEGRGTVVAEGQPVSVAWLADLLELENSPPGEARNKSRSRLAGPAVPCVILALGNDRLGLLVEQLLDEQEIVLKAQSKLLQRVRNVSGATILGTGEVCILLNPQDLVQSARRREAAIRTTAAPEEAMEKKLILMAEDSLTTRIQLKRILEGAGYEVVTAVDGLDAYSKLGARPFDALVSDIMMPHMSGLDLTEKVRQNSQYRELPIILVTSLASEEDRQRGLEAGANAYITKPAFDQRVLLDTLKRLI